MKNLFVTAIFYAKGAANGNPMFIRNSAGAIEGVSDIKNATRYLPIDEGDAAKDFAAYITSVMKEHTGFGPEAYPVLVPVYVQVNEDGTLYDDTHFNFTKAEIMKSLKYVDQTFMPMRKVIV